MTSMFDQFEQAFLRTKNNNISTAEMVGLKKFFCVSPNVNIFVIEYSRIHKYDVRSRSSNI